MPGANITPNTDFQGAPDLGTLDLSGVAQAAEVLPGIALNLWPHADWYGQAQGPAGFGWYSQASRDNRIDAFVPFTAANSPTLTDNLIGSQPGLQFSGGTDEILSPSWGNVATASTEGDYMDDLAMNTSEGSFFTVVKHTDNVSSYVLGQLSKPAAAVLLGAGGGELVTLLISPLSSGAEQYVRVLYGNGTVRMGSNAAAFRFTTAASIGFTWHPTRGTALYINNVQVAADPADTAGMVSGRFQIGRRANSASFQATHKQGMLVTSDVALDGTYDTERTAFLTKVHTHYSPDLSAL